MNKVRVTIEIGSDQAGANDIPDPAFGDTVAELLFRDGPWDVSLKGKIIRVEYAASDYRIAK